MLLPVTFGFIFYKLFYAYNIQSLIKQINLVWDFNTIALLSLTLILMGANWLLEIVKWQLLVRKNEHISFKEAAQGVLSGVALNMITPNQLGDFVGRVMHLKKLDNVRGTLVTVIGHTAQVIMTAAFGLFAFIWFLLQRNYLNVHQADILYAILFVLVVITVVAYLNLALLNKLPLNAKIKPYLNVFKLYSRSELVQVLSISFLRYIIFLTQYYCLLQVFGVTVSIEQALACIVATICAQSFVPSFILVEVGMRGASAVWFFEMFTPQLAQVLLAAYSLWIINLMTPGLVGLGILMRWKKEVKSV